MPPPSSCADVSSLVYQLWVASDEMDADFSAMTPRCKTLLVQRWAASLGASVAKRGPCWLVASWRRRGGTPGVRGSRVTARAHGACMAGHLEQACIAEAHAVVAACDRRTNLALASLMREPVAETDGEVLELVHRVMEAAEHRWQALLAHSPTDPRRPWMDLEPHAGPTTAFCRTMWTRTTSTPTHTSRQHGRPLQHIRRACDASRLNAL